MTALTEEEKKLAEKVEAAVNPFISPPISTSVDDLLLLLHKLESCLSAVEQSPSNCVQKALNPAIKVLTTKKLINHSNVDVKVGVAACICEILRITAPDAPYGDEQMKEICKLIVAAFDNLSDISSPSYRRRVSILETFSKIRLWIVMLDLECNSLILEMFELFLRNVRENHPEVVFLSMGLIMIMVLEEAEDISPELLSPILSSVRKGNQSVLPIAQKLGERVIENCVSELVPYMSQAVEYMGFPLDDYDKVIAYICAQNHETLNRNNVFRDSRALKHQVSQYGELVDQDLGPPWLEPMLRASYFVPCSFHKGSSKNKCNLFCLDCMGNALCSCCSINHKDHRIIEIMQSSNHNAVRVNEIQKYMDISRVQTCITGRSKFVYLNEQPQPRFVKGVTATCEICCRSLLLLDCFRFCSIACKAKKSFDQEISNPSSVNKSPKSELIKRSPTKRSKNGSDNEDKYVAES
ncbi:sister chromatid cohesion protein PDS5 homolog C-like isoform X2 [Mercurialis annua]|uniref:sister chromatid cohesion protein PDS5 homolog C-like isoform X2 n=1 Tax=Mercurialis annua TaxID=3986 RepID=UPI00215F094C|nr:sister chromatid cohesion protein PDS5 homolog C-like isoform X2 [Mercurialis annua]